MHRLLQGQVYSASFDYPANNSNSSDYVSVIHYSSSPDADELLPPLYVMVEVRLQLGLALSASLLLTFRLQACSQQPCCSASPAPGSVQVAAATATTGHALAGLQLPWCAGGRVCGAAADGQRHRIQSRGCPQPCRQDPVRTEAGFCCSDVG